jgi:hypothetical protein
MERACETQLAFQQSSAEFLPIPEPVVLVPKRPSLSTGRR